MLKYYISCWFAWICKSSCRQIYMTNLYFLPIEPKYKSKTIFFNIKGEPFIIFIIKNFVTPLAVQLSRLLSGLESVDTFLG